MLNSYLLPRLDDRATNQLLLRLIEQQRYQLILGIRNICH